ncbi:MAG: hypothetical protein GQ535_08765 [Rhodobacteraceae bacterium]|nr:hypothetical protein [Paracoccaceae bacterium]
MFQVNLEKIGCGQKVSMRELHKVAELSGIDPTADCQSQEIDGVEFLSSIDRIGRFCEDTDIYCQLAVLHAAMDITVAGGDPKIASICIEYGPEFSSIEETAELTKSIQRALSSLDMSAQNLHSVRSDYTHLTIAVTGTRRVIQTACQESGRVYISRKIGASKLLVLNAMEGEDIEDISNEIFGNRFLGSSVASVSAADITGFGLAGAAYNLCLRLGVRASLTLSAQHLFANEVLSVPMPCFEALALPDAATSAQCRRLEIVSKCIEFAGPALMFVPEDSVSEFEMDFFAKHKQSPIQLGDFVQDRLKPGADYIWES